MKRTRNTKLGQFLLRLTVAYIVLIALSPMVRGFYNEQLGDLSARLISALAKDDVDVTCGWLDEMLHFRVFVRSNPRASVDPLRVGIDPRPFSYPHITFLALALATPAWSWRHRLVRWVAGALVLQALSALAVTLNAFCLFSDMNHPYWSGDLLTTVLPYRLYWENVNYITIVGEQVTPIALWLALFVFPLRGRRHAVSSARTLPRARASRLMASRSG